MPQLDDKEREQLGDSPVEELERGDDLPTGRHVSAEELERIPTASNADMPSSERMGDAGGNASGRFSLSRAVKRRLIIAIGISGFAGVFAAVGFFLFLPLKIIHIEENIVHYFDKRMEHTINKRAPRGYRALFDEQGKVKGYRPDGRHPIRDAYASYKINKLEADLGVNPKFDRSGKLIGFTNAAGEYIDASDSSLADRRSAVRELIDSHYPEEGFIHRSIRARNLNAAWGIKWKFLENIQEKITDKQAALLNELKDAIVKRIKGQDSGTNTEEAAKEQQLKDSIKSHGGDAKGTSAKAAAALGPAGYVVQACGAEAIAQDLKDSLMIVRVAQEMRFAFIIVSTADQLKRGDVHPSQFSQLIKGFAGFEKAGGWQRITGNTKARVTDSSKFAADGGPGVTKVINTVTSSSFLNKTCGAVNSTAGTVTIIGVDAAVIANAEDGFGEAITAALWSIGKNIAKSAVFSVVASQLVNMATDAANSTVVDFNSSAPDKVDATIAGMDNYFNQSNRGNGGERLTGTQVAELNAAADQDYAQTAAQKGLAYQMFSPDYDKSLVSVLILETPTSAQDLVSGFNSTLATISVPFSPREIGGLGRWLDQNTTDATAFNAADLQEDPTGYDVPQFGIDDQLLDKYPNQPDNEQWVQNYLCSASGPDGSKPIGSRGLYDGQCTTGDTAAAANELLDGNNSHDDAYHRYIQKCKISTDPNSYLDDPECSSKDDVHQRFIVYRLDVAIANYIKSNNNDNNDQNPSNNGVSSTTGSTSSSGALTNPFPDGWTPGRVDMGYDGHFTNQIVSPCDGHVSAKFYSSGPHSWEGYFFTIECNSVPSGIPTHSFYFSEGITPKVSQNATVHAGQQIAVPGPTGFSEGPGGIEWGLASDKTPTQTYAEQVGVCSSTAASAALDFASQWVTQNFNPPLAPYNKNDPANTPGCA